MKHKVPYMKYKVQGKKRGRRERWWKPKMKKLNKQRKKIDKESQQLDNEGKKENKELNEKYKKKKIEDEMRNVKNL